MNMRQPHPHFLKLSKAYLLTASLLGALCTTSAMAQATPEELQRAQQDAERRLKDEQLRQQRDRDETTRANRPGSAIDPRSLAPLPAVSPQGGACRDIQTVDIKGASLLSQRQRERIVSNFVPKCLTASDIESLMAELTKAYVDMGYVTSRVYLPSQDLTKGQLTLLVLEGKVEKIVIRDGREEGRSSVNVSTIFPGVTGSVLNLRDIEQGLDQINRLSSNSATMAIEPGEKAGGSVIAIDNKPKFPLSFNASLDNQGSTSTGKWQLGVTLSYDNPLTLDDFFTVTHRESRPNDPERKYSGSDSFTYVVPFGYNTFTWGTSRSSYMSIVVLASGQEARSAGNSNTTFYKLDRVLYRNQVTRFNGSVTLTDKSSANYFAEQLLGVSSRTLQVLDLDTSLKTSLGSGIFGLDLGFAQGLKHGGALVDADNLPDTQPRAQFRKIKFGLNYMLPFNVGMKAATFNSQITGQYALDTLYGSEQISAGGIYAVRGHVRNALSADHGFVWRNDLSIQQSFTAFGQTFNARPYIGFDYGQVKQYAYIPDAPEGSMTC